MFCVPCSRLISAIRDSSASSAPTTATSRGVLGQEWDRNINQEYDDLDVEERTVTGRKKKKSRGRVAVADMEPTPEVRNLLGSANLAYVHGRTKEAIDTLNEVIRIEPSTKSAWYTLSTIQEELGNMDKAIQLRIVVAHLTKNNVETWKELGAQSKQLGLLEQAIYCYGEAIQADRSDVEAIWDRATLFRETGKIRQAATWFFKLLKLQPHSPAILRELGPLYYDLNEVSKAVQLYQAAYDHFRSLYPVPSISQEELQGWSFVDFELYSDFLRSLKRYKEAGKIIIEGVRWLQGRIEEGPSWNSFGDDREYDLERKWRNDWQKHPSKWCEETPIYHLDTGLRLRLGLARLYEGRYAEAKVCCPSYIL
jgi:general transcription factor 3C polypeptide 3 (transcription factor C subunit 4)